MTKTRDLPRGYLVGGKVYGPGQKLKLEDEVAETIDAFRKEFEQETFDPAKATAGQEPNLRGEDALSDRLDPQTASLLHSHGFESVDDVKNASDDDLKAIRGVGDAKLAEIREQVGAAGQ